MNDAIKQLTAKQGNLSHGDIETLYQAHLCGTQFMDEAERTGESAASRAKRPQCAASSGSSVAASGKRQYLICARRPSFT